jgi:iron complex outermembrane recepter protein
MKNRLMKWVVTAALMAGCWGSNAQQKPLDLTQLSLEELMNIEVTLGAKKGETILETAASIEVITQEDLRRSGVNSIPEALRMVPGLDVARNDANKWAISSRGFNNIFANKLLVLVDGRSAYSPIFSGVFWEAQDLLLEDLDRIEVIRGPGAALWGANAVNGIINIITRHTRDTRGVFVKQGTGSNEKSALSFRVGGKLGSAAFGRVYAKYFERNPFEYETPDRIPGHWQEAADGWNVLRGGFRVDGDFFPKTEIAFQGDAYIGDVGQTMTLPKLNLRLTNYSTRIWGGNLLGRVRRIFSDASDMTLQMTFDRIQRNENIVLGGGYHTFDADFQHRFRALSSHEIIWGVGYRITGDHIDSTELIAFRPPRRIFSVTSAFIQDEIGLSHNRLRLTVGSKFEHNDLSGFEFQPNVRMLFRIDQKNSAWCAVSRAVRTPSRADQDIRVNIIGMVGSHDYKAERLYAYEIGSHHQAYDRLMADVTVFYNDFYGLMSFENDTVANKRACRSYGAEFSMKWNPFAWCRLKTGYTFLRMQTRVEPDSREIGNSDANGESPRHQAFARTSFQLPRSTDVDLMVRYVDALPSLQIRRYTALDLRLSWKPIQEIELAVAGQNLNLRRHMEFRGWWIPYESTQIPRSVTVTMSMKL